MKTHGRNTNGTRSGLGCASLTSSRNIRSLIFLAMACGFSVHHVLGGYGSTGCARDQSAGAAVGISQGISTSSTKFTGQMSRGEVTQHPSRHNHRTFLVDKGFLRFHNFGLDNLKHSPHNQWRQRVRGQESGCLQNCNKQRGLVSWKGG